MTKQQSAVIVGVGAEKGLGAALAQRFARERYRVFIAGRTTAKLEKVARAIAASGGAAVAVVADASIESDVTALFDRADADGTLDFVAFNAASMARGALPDLSANLFEQAWRVGALGGFLVSREAARRLAPRRHGSIIFTGATASLRGKPPFAAFASAKAALRSLAQAAARELGPQGVHVAHVIIDGGIDGERLNAAAPNRKAESGEDGLLNVDAIADVYWNLHRQHRSAWTHELDLRPFKEPF